MTYAAALNDLKQAFGDKKLLTPAEIAPHIGKSAAAQAKLRDRGRFPIKIKRGMGSQVVMSIYDVARYIGEEIEDEADSTQPERMSAPTKASRSTTRKPTSSAKVNTSKAYRRPPSLGKFLLGFQSQIAAAEAALEFDRQLFAALEAVHMNRKLGVAD